MTYYIKRTREFFGPSYARDLIAWGNGDPIPFASRKDAQAWIDDTYKAPYHLAHNETGRCAYQIIRHDRLPAYLAQLVDA